MVEMPDGIVEWLDAMVESLDAMVRRVDDSVESTDAGVNQADAPIRPPDDGADGTKGSLRIKEATVSPVPWSQRSRCIGRAQATAPGNSS